MAFFIAYGQIDKKLILLVFITIVRTINIIVSHNDETSNGMLCSLEEEIGPIIAGVILYFIFRHKISKSGTEKRSIKHLLILFLLRSIKSGYEKIFPFIVKDSNYRFNSMLSTTNGVEIFIITGGTFLILNYKYHIHHMISMVIFCALGIGMDFIFQSYYFHFDYIYIYIAYIINEVLVYCYLKYMMDKLYYQYTEIILYWGLTGLIVKLFIFSGLSLYEYINDIKGYIFKLKNFFVETSLVNIIFLQFFYYILDSAIYFPLIMLLLFYLRPNHMIITDEIHVYLGIILYPKKPNIPYSILPFIFQIFALMFYFEILEFNFCGLNENTVKNIQERESKQGDIDNSDTSTIEINGQYYMKTDAAKGDEDNRSNSLINNFLDKSISVNDDDEYLKNKNFDESAEFEISRKK